MQSYINSILDRLPGETPKAKFESLIGLESKLNQQIELLKTLLESPDSAELANLKSFISANLESLEK